MKATIAMTKEAQKRGEYKETSLDAYKTINDTLVHLFNEIWELEEKAISYR